MPKLVVRREGKNLSSTFVTVMEPYVETFASRLLRKVPHIDDMQVLKTKESYEGDVSVAITHGKTIDIVLSSPYHPGKPMIVDDITLEGKMGFIRVENGKVKSMYLIGGTLLKKVTELTHNGPFTGTILQPCV